MQSSSESEGGTDVTVQRPVHRVLSVESEEEEGQARIGAEEEHDTHLQQQEVVDDEEV